MTDNDPRMDPVGTVRTHEGRTAVKAAMGDDSGKGGHVWLGITDGTVRVYHHADVRSWAVTASPVSSPEGGDSTADETPWKLSPGDTILYAGEDEVCQATVLQLGEPKHHEALVQDDVGGKPFWLHFDDCSSVRGWPASSVRDTAETTRRFTPGQRVTGEQILVGEEVEGTWCPRDIFPEIRLPLGSDWVKRGHGYVEVVSSTLRPADHTPGSPA